ncbi:tape measure protein [Psychrobacter sanguinis]|uniref:tape measure protein n=1 Tax=Psychrobacter sanguinis TaxID=861445 RepID=UPI00191ABC80|nr:tape measure protein [Psychrobacter sanguinis]MCC3344848.1 tape measure protein [Psychrobacter sanguinis]
MEQTSRLSIVVDTTKAKTQIIDFNKRLEQMRLEGDKSSKAIGEIGSKANFSGLNQGLKAAQSNMAALSSTAKVSSNSLRAFSSVADNAAVATRKLSAAARELKNSSAGINANFNALAAVAASATKLSTAMRQASTSANSLKQFSQSANTSIVALNATLNLGASSLNKFSQAAVTAGQRLNTFGRAVTQTQTRLNGLNTNLASVRASMASLATASNSINAIFGNMNNTIGRLAAATDRLNNATTRANTAINQLGGNLGGANNQARGLLGTLNSLHGLLSSGLLAISGIGILKTADAMQSLNSQIKLVTNSEEEYLGIKQLLSDVADRNYSDIQATTDLYQKSARALANLGKSQADTIKFTEGVSLAMRTGGRSALEQSSAIYQLSQSMGAGVVNGDEFRTITETAPLLLQLVAKELGVTTGALKKLSSEGKIPAEVMFNAVTNNIQLLEEMAKQMPITMGQGFTLVKSRYKKFVDDMMNETGGFSSKIAGALAKISTKFDVMAKGAIAVGILAFIQFAGSVNIAAKAMALFNLAMKANPIVLVATAVLGVASAFYGLEDVLDTTGLILGDLISAMGAGFRGLGNLVSTISEGISKAFGESNENVSKSYDGFFDNTAKGFSGFLQGVGRVAAAATATFNGFFSWMGNGFWQALRVAGNAFIWLGNTAKSIITEAGRTITDLINGAIGGINWLSESANDILSKTPITWRFKAIGEVEWRNPNYTQTPYFTITGDTLSENISKKYDFLKKGVDDYFAGPNGLAARSEAKRKEQSPYSPSTAEMDPKLAAMYRWQLAQDELEAAKKAEKKAKKGGKDKVQGKPVNAKVLAQAAQYRYADLEKEYNLPSGILAAVSMQESRGVANARGPKTKYGVAKGAFQFLDGTARENGVRNSDNVEQSARGAARYLSKLINQFGSVSVGIAAYNAGPGNTKKHGGKIPPFKETQNYVKEVNKYMAYMQGGIDGSVNIAGNIEALQKKADDAQKEYQAILKEQDDILKEYQSTPERIKSEFDERVARIGKAGFDKQTQHDLNRKAEAIYQREMAVYQNSLDQKLDALTEYQQTESDKIERHREKLLFDLAVDPEYQLPENKDRLEAAKKAIDEEYEYATDKNQQRINAATNELYAFRKTEREILKEGYDNRISEALLMNDELKQLRIEALLEEQRYQLELFDKNQEMEMLELSKAHMTEMSYLKAEYDLKTKLIALSNADPEVKQAKEAEAKIVFERAQADVQKRVGGDYDAQTRGLFGISSAEADLAASNKSQRDIAEKAFQEGYIQEEEYKQRLLDLETDFANKKQAIIVGGYESAFGMAAQLTKAFGGGQSRIYRAMYAVEKGFAFSRIFLENKVALAKAWASAPFPYNLPAVGITALQTGVLAAAVETFTPQGFKQGGYTGSIGINEVAGVVHGQEYVFDAQATKAIGVENLERIRRGKGTGEVNITVNNHSSAKVETETDSQGNIIMTIRDEVKRSWSNLQNANSHESKMMSRSFQAPRRR